MNPTTPTPAETPQEIPTPRMDTVNTGILDNNAYHKAMAKGREIERELTALREKLAEEQAGAASMREALQEVLRLATMSPEERKNIKLLWLLMQLTHVSHSALNSTTTGKATLEELERLRSLCHHASLKITGREEGDGMTPDEILAAIDDMQRKARSDFERIEALRAEVERLKASARTDGEWKSILAERDSANAEVERLRAEVEKLTEGYGSACLRITDLEQELAKPSPPVPEHKHVCHTCDGTGFSDGI